MASLNNVNIKNIVVWNKKIENTNLEKFKNFAKKNCNKEFESYWDLHDWSIHDPNAFWENIWDYFKVTASVKYEKIFQKTGPEFYDHEWFVGAKFNYAENLLRHRDEKIAITYLDEEGNFEEVTYKKLYEEVQLYSTAFRMHGLQKGDVVACYMSNRKEAIFAMLAALSIGALWGGPEPYAGEMLTKQLLEMMAPKFLITQDCFQYQGKTFKLLQNLNSFVNNSTSLIKTIIVPSKQRTMDINSLKNSCFLEDFLEMARCQNLEADIIFEQLPANHPININFTSGTTGVPKALVHSARVLLSQLVDVGLHMNISEKDVVFNQTPVGWLIWNVLDVSLSLGANFFLFNGSCTHIGANNQTVWDVISKYKVKLIFLTPTDIDKMEKEDIIPNTDSNWTHFQMLFLTAEPAKKQNYEFLLKYFNSNLYIGNGYGATEVFGCITAFDLNLTGYALECQVPCLGKNLQCVDEKGVQVIGQTGELIIRNPFPSLISYILNDVNNEYLKKVYLVKHPGHWCQSDQCYINPDTRGIRVIGRSDNLITKNGVSFMGSEIYSSIETIEEIDDCICVGQTNSDGVSRAVLFIKLKNGYTFSDSLKDKISQNIERQFLKEYVPDVILETPDIPYNFSKKKLEKVVQTIINTNQIPKVSKIRNPECLTNFVDIAILKKFNTCQDM